MASPVCMLNDGVAKCWWMLSNGRKHFGKASPAGCRTPLCRLLRPAEDVLPRFRPHDRPGGGHRGALGRLSATCIRHRRSYADSREMLTQPKHLRHIHLRAQALIADCLLLRRWRCSVWLAALPMQNFPRMTSPKPSCTRRVSVQHSSRVSLAAIGCSSFIRGADVGLPRTSLC